MSVATPVPAPETTRARAPLVAPAAVRAVELTAPLAPLALDATATGRAHRTLLLLVRLDGAPLGTVTLALTAPGPVPVEAYAAAVRSELATELAAALAARGRSLPDVLPADGLDAGPPPAPAPDAGPWVTVVVTTCRNPVPLGRCLASLLASDHDRFDVVVGENRPGADATRALLDERFPGDPRLSYVEEPRPGLSSARNAGLARARGEAVAFVDDDVVVDPGWLGSGARALLAADDVACATGLILPLGLEAPSQVLLEQFAAFGKGFGRRVFRLEAERAVNPLFPYTSGHIGSGANLFARTRELRDVDGFDPALGTGTQARGGEELDLFIRLLQRGWAIVYEPRALVWHDHPVGRRRLRRQAYGYGVGLTAMLTKQLVAGPDRTGLLRRVPGGVRYALDPASRKNAGKEHDFPRELQLLEWLGLLSGPLAYLRSAHGRDAPLGGPGTA